MTDSPKATLQPLVLIVDDEPQIRRFLRAGFEMQSFRVIEAETARQAIDLAVMRAPDLIVLDLGLPDADGATVLDTLRSWSQSAIIVLSVRNAEAEKVALLEKGADDYIVKPFGMAELLARARVVLRRIASRAAPEPVLRIGSLSIDLVQRIVSRDGGAITLSPKQFALLRALAAHHGKVLTHRQLIKELWPQNPDEDVQYLRILMKKLRNRIERDPARPIFVVTELAIGYRLRTQEQLDAAGYAEAMQ
ncbi:response regulator [Bosea sp. BIWAKO-01]|uniref:response regulator n=1 Tax=Bosea sp. BIWAKO-01 TaxID=506668 RepID=UPI000853E448|nr:response regulator [Bosea sp. BIWAKO-01]GAU84369.1 sensor histidine kinase [Bosea sp. BIWAKO-01]